MYIPQTFHSVGERSGNLLDFFDWNKKSPKRYLLVADQGEGKSTSVKYATISWCDMILSKDYQESQMIKYQRESLIKGQVGAHITGKDERSILDPIWNMLPEPYKMQLIDEFFITKDLNPLPELILAFEFKDLCSHKLLEDILLTLIEEEDLTRDNIKAILDRGRDSILFAFDGYDEFTKFQLCQNGVSSEVEAIIKRETRKNYNLLVTSRPWRSDDLLSVERFGFRKLSLVKAPIDREVRNKFIKNFFLVMEEDLSDGLIIALDSEKNIIPPELITTKRMLLYVCHIYKYNVYSQTEEEFYSEAAILNNLWELMRLTYNKKYPEGIMSKDDLQEMRHKIGQLDNPGNLTYEEMNHIFGDDNKYDIFFFGIYSTAAMKKVGHIGENVKETTVIKETPGLERLVLEEKKKYQIKEEEDDQFEKSDTNWMLSTVMSSLKWTISIGLMIFVMFIIFNILLEFLMSKRCIGMDYRTKDIIAFVFSLLILYPTFALLNLII